jgi:hypothetical protein
VPEALAVGPRVSRQTTGLRTSRRSGATASRVPTATERPEGGHHGMHESRRVRSSVWRGCGRPGSRSCRAAGVAAGD